MMYDPLGTAWLSSVREVKSGIKFSNRTQPSKLYFNFSSLVFYTLIVVSVKGRYEDEVKSL